MKANITKLLYTYVATFLMWVLVFIVQKPLFMICYHDKLPEGNSLLQCLEVVYHGLSLDLSMAGYLTCLPALLVAASPWIRKTILRRVMTAYTAVAALIVAIAFVVNIGLYAYWKFPLDATPVFYFLTSPKDAMASLTIWMTLGGLAAILIIATLIAWACIKTTTISKYSILAKTNDKHEASSSYKIRLMTSAVMLLLSALLVIPIRGGFTVSTTNIGKAYFSEKAILNHSAVNPLFSFIESVSHQEDFASMYRFMDDKEATALVSPMINTSSEGTTTKLNCQRPDVYIFVMESFSMELWKTNAVPHLQQIAKEGIMFTHFYANSFRTDRGLVAILGGFPAQPTMSIMKYPKKTAKLPSIAAHLKANGYGLKYYYGGDADFTNMRSYLVGQGFENIVSDESFPMKERMSKWGVPDGYVFARLKQDLQSEKPNMPMLRVLQTSSSHEPFDVPYHKLADERLNAFAYADSCVGNFIATLKKTDRWKNSLVIIVPDHQGCWPKDISDYAIGHYHIPMIWTGGAIKAAEEISTIGSQQDIAATLLGQFGIDHSDMKYSKDMLCPNVAHFAFFTDNDLVGLITEDNIMLHDNKLKKVVVDEGTHKGANINKGKAYLQKLYDHIAEL